MDCQISADATHNHKELPAFAPFIDSPHIPLPSPSAVQAHLLRASNSHAMQSYGFTAMQPHHKIGHRLHPSVVAAASDHMFGSGIFLDPRLRGTPLDPRLDAILGAADDTGLVNLEQKIRRLAEQGLESRTSKAMAIEGVVAVAVSGVKAARRSLMKDTQATARLCTNCKGKGVFGHSFPFPSSALPFLLPTPCCIPLRRELCTATISIGFISNAMECSLVGTAGPRGQPDDAKLVQELEKKIQEMDAELSSLRLAGGSGHCLEAELCGDVDETDTGGDHRKELLEMESELQAKEAELDTLRSSNKFYRGRVEELSREAESREALQAAAGDLDGAQTQAGRVLEMEAELRELRDSRDFYRSQVEERTLALEAASSQDSASAALAASRAQIAKLEAENEELDGALKKNAQVVECQVSKEEDSRLCLFCWKGSG